MNIKAARLIKTRKYIKKAFILSFLLFLCGCLQKGQKNNQFNKFPSQDSLAAQIISGDFQINDPYDIAIRDKQILISEKKANYPLRILNLNKNELDRLSIRKGRGPGEVIAPSWLSVYNGRFQALDIVKNSLYTLQLPSTKREKASFEEVKIGQIVGDFAQNAETIFFTGYFSNGRLGSYNKETGTFTEIGEIADIDIPLAVYNNAHDGYIATSADGKQVAIGQRYTDVLKIYDSNNGSIVHKVKGPINEPLKFEPGKNVEAHLKEDNYIGYKALYNYKNNLWCMFSGYHMSKQHAYHADKLVVFTWQGKPLKKYQLDRHLLVTALDKENDYLYGISAEPKIELVRYDLD